MADTYAELLSRRDKLAHQQAEIAKQLADMERARRADAIQKIRDLMNQYGLTPVDLGPDNYEAQKARFRAKGRPKVSRSR